MRSDETEQSTVAGIFLKHSVLAEEVRSVGWAYYNESDRYCCEWLRNLIRGGLIADGEVDERSIELVQPDDVRGFVQAHWFSGIGGWAHALRLAGWPDDRPVWTGSCPCQPFSCAGKGAGTKDERHLWPDFFRLIRAARPPVVMGEQVAGKAGYGWFDGVRADLAGEGYASRGVDIPACSVDAPHRRNRIYWVALADPDHARRRTDNATGDDIDGTQAGRNQGDRNPEGRGGSGAAIGDALLKGLSPPEREAVLGTGRGCEGREPGESGRALGNTDCAATQLLRKPEEFSGEAEAVEGEGHQRERGGNPAWNPSGRNGTFWSDAEWITGADGKSRRVGIGVRRVAHGLPAGMDSLCPAEEAATPVRLSLFTHGEPAPVGKLKGLGNAIVPQIAAEVVRALMECKPAV